MRSAPSLALGDNEHDYGDGVTVNHEGFVNASAAYDEVQSSFSELAGFGGDDLKTTITDNEAYIEDGGVPVASYLAPGTEHTILGRPALYDIEVDGTSFLDWLTAYANGEDVPDVACGPDCGGPDEGA